MNGLTRQKTEIGKNVVCSVSVNVMHNLTSFEGSSDMLFHDETMLKNSATIDRYFPIPIMGDSARSVRVNLREGRIAKSFESLIMDVAIAEGFMFPITALDGADKRTFSFGPSLSYAGITVLSGALKMHRTQPPSAGKSTAIFDRTKMFHNLPLCKVTYYNIHLEKANCKEKNNGANRVNSGKPATGNAVGNPEPSQGYTLGRCRDYWRGKSPLNNQIKRPARKG